MPIFSRFFPGAPNGRCACSLVCALCLFCVSESFAVAGRESQTYAKALAEESRKNAGKFTSGKLRWARRTLDDGFNVAGRKEKVITTGIYEMWWKDGKIATAYSGEDETIGPDEREEDRKDRPVRTGVFGVRKAYNGRDFRQVRNIDSPKDIAISNDSQFSARENWFLLAGMCDSTGRGNSRFPGYDLLGFAEKRDECEVKWEVRDGLIRLLFTNLKTNGTRCFLYDPKKGFGCVRDEATNERGQLCFSTIMKWEEVIPGAFLPTVIDYKSYDGGKDGKITLHNYFALHLEQCVFNEPSKIEDAVFEIETVRGQEVSDYRGGFRINYDTDMDALSMGILEKATADFLDQPSAKGKSSSLVGKVGDTLVTSATLDSEISSSLSAKYRPLVDAEYRNRKILFALLALTGSLLACFGAIGLVRRTRGQSRANRQ